jgi:glutathione S-transferase
MSFSSATVSSAAINPLSWDELTRLAASEQERVQGPTNAQANLRLFGHDPNNVQVTLFRDHHAWCPYCQKIWLWLEFKRIPYKIQKVTMRCYGPKEPWFLEKVPSGMLPALELNGELLTESDVILLALEQQFGPLGGAMTDPDSLELRHLERLLFRAWCTWLCSPGLTSRQQHQAQEQFRVVAQRFEQELNTTPGPWLRSDQPETVDLLFVPYVERMNASLAYYKGYRLRREHPSIDRWFRALESLETYRGTQSDMHTHVHDLPPQMGGCWSDNSELATELAAEIDRGDGLGVDEAVWPDESLNGQAPLALSRVLRHRLQLLKRSPIRPQGIRPAVALRTHPTHYRSSLSTTKRLCCIAALPTRPHLHSTRYALTSRASASPSPRSHGGHGWFTTGGTSGGAKSVRPRPQGFFDSAIVV